MTTDSDKCSFSSLLPMSCRGRAEAFARRLHSRLRSLGSQDGRTADENSWLAANENPVAVTQPRHSSDSDLYLDFSLLESPGSPDEEIPESDLVNLITNNKDNLPLAYGDDCHCSKQNITAISLNSNGRTISPDSDSSDGQYFDPDTDDDQKVIINSLLDGYNSLHNSSITSEESVRSLTVSDEDSTLDLQDCPSLEFNSFSQEIPASDSSDVQGKSKNVDESSVDTPRDVTVTQNILSSTEEPIENLYRDHTVEVNSVNDVDISTSKFKSGNTSTLHLPSVDGELISPNELHAEVSVSSNVCEEGNHCLVNGIHHVNLSDSQNLIPSHSDISHIENAINDLEKSTKEYEMCKDVNNLNSAHVVEAANCGLNNSEESYCSTLRIEHNLTVDFNNTSSSALENKVEVNIQPNISEIEDREEPTPRVRRCSSLKTGKTPPGTPGRKKIVRFADVLGLDLADVRTFLDEIPKIPNSAYNDLSNADLCTSLSDHCLNSTSDNNYGNSRSKADKVLVPLFEQPGGQVDFLDRVKKNQVCLENAVVDDLIALSVKGTVRVRNLDFNKSVHIRYSLDTWKSYSDLKGTYVPNSCDGFSDKFSFLLYANTITVGQRLEFAVRFQCKGCQYWDSNNGTNYAFQCLPATNQTPYAPITGEDDHWGATFY